MLEKRRNRKSTSDRISIRTNQFNQFRNTDPNMNTKKVAVVTGGMGGLGEAICKKLAVAGYQVVTTYSPKNDNAQLWLESQAAEGFNFSAYMLDVSDYASCEAGVANIMRDAGSVDILVNNASITREATLGKMTVEHWRQIRQTDLDSLFNMTKQVINGMLEREWGRIINISCIDSQKGAFEKSHFGSAKAGVHGFTKALALEVARKNITVNTVSPGYLGTSRLLRISKKILQTKILPEIPVGRLGDPAEVAALIAYLVSEDAAFVTGADIAINGGQHMH
jgi:acetoacetyl-CoA reductase